MATYDQIMAQQQAAQQAALTAAQGNPFMNEQMRQAFAAQAGAQAQQSALDQAEADRRLRLLTQEVKRPDWISNIDAETGKMKDAFQVQAGQIDPLKSNLQELDQRMGKVNLNTQGLEAIRQRALSQGPSAWAQMAEQKQRMEEGQQRSDAAAQGASAQAQARSQLAMRGGLSGGARQRLAMQGARDMAAQGQQVGAQGQLARANIGLQDEQTRNQMLSQLPGMELQALQPEMQKVSAWQQMAGTEQGQDFQRQQFNQNAAMSSQQFNVANALKEQQAQNAANMQLYQEQMKDVSAERQARSTEKAGKK